MTSEDLENLSHNPERQNLFKKYFNEKKKEAETKLMSSTMVNSAFALSPVGQVY